MKIALVSTPRSGNTWLRMLLAAAYGFEQHAVHDPYSLDWAELPDRTIVQVHWNPDERFLGELRGAGVQPLTIARHPLDVLISILHFCGHEPETRNWLLGAGGDESDICFKTPADAEFLRYACGLRAARLLSVSADWWVEASCWKLRYEDLVRNPAAVIGSLEPNLGAPAISIDEVVAAHGLTRLATSSQNQHFWQGRPGLWADLISPEWAREICKVHAQVFRDLGYSMEWPDRVLPASALDTWKRLG